MFHRIPAGARYLEADPRIQEESRRAAQTWALQLAQEIMTGSSGHTAAQSAADADRISAIDELLRASGTLRTGRQVILQMLDRLQQSQGDTLPAAFWEGRTGIWATRDS